MILVYLVHSTVVIIMIRSLFSFSLTPTLATILMVQGLGVRIIVIAGISSSILSSTAPTTCIEAARSETQP